MKRFRLVTIVLKRGKRIYFLLPVSHTTEICVARHVEIRQGIRSLSVVLFS